VVGSVELGNLRVIWQVADQHLRFSCYYRRPGADSWYLLRGSQYTTCLQADTEPAHILRATSRIMSILTNGCPSGDYSVLEEGDGEYTRRLELFSYVSQQSFSQSMKRGVVYGPYQS
jgi:hypothetical protein